MAKSDACWQERAHNSTAALCNADYTRAITESTLGLDELLQHQIRLLDTRAAAYGKTGQFRHGLDDAHAMMQLAPRSPQGYLRAGELYGAQGLQRRAIELYDRGLAAVSATDGGSSYGQLQQARALAIEHEGRRLDLLGALPFDVLGHLVTHLEMETLIECLGVCRVWRERLLGCPDGWQRIQIDSNDPSTEAVYRHLPAVSSYVHTLSAINFLDQISASTFRLLASGCFTRLRSLTLRRCKISDWAGLLVALHRVSGTLTNLTLSSIGQVPGGLPTLLSTCMHLTSLGYRSVPQLGDEDASALPATLPLEFLDLEAHNIRCEQLAPILARCPNLRHLIVYKCEARTIQLIERYCPQLERLYFNVYRMHHESETARLSKDTSRGLCTLAFGRVEHALVEHLPTFLARAADTAEHLQLQIDMEDDATAAQLWRPVVHGPPFTALRSLSITVHDALHATIAALVRQCPNLTHATFSYSSLLAADVLLALADLPHLRELSLHSVRSISHAGIEYFIQRHRALGRDSPLRVFDTDHVCDLSSAALSALAEIPTLERIRLDHCDNASVAAMNLFAENLVKTASACRRLELCRLDGVNDAFMLQLSKAPALQHLDLMRLHGLTDQGIANLVDSSPLASLWIYDCPLVSNYMRDHVQHVLARKSLPQT